MSRFLVGCLGKRSRMKYDPEQSFANCINTLPFIQRIAGIVAMTSKNSERSIT